ncbi:polysaccharide biosynthesis/export family protein [Luteolibacter sp. Populi]|uniref:polysaccharide biosynthesis/export family protein n=1 Tax=Luteolibacter sp. Populi TaxID=3230487 RepID=UPI0034672129
MKAFALISLLALAPLHAEEKPRPIVTVGGQVRAPGPVEYTKELTLYTAVQMARGATEFGAMNRVKLIRDGKTKEYDLRKDENKTVTLKPSDIVEVPSKYIGC